MSQSRRLERILVGDTSSHECATRLWFTSVAKTAVRDPRAALVSALAVSGACALGLPAILLAIPLTYALRFTVGLFDKSVRRSTLHRAGTLPIALPSPLSFSDERARGIIDRLERSRWAIKCATLASPSGSPFALAGLIEDIPQLERDVVVLAARLEYLGRFLSTDPSAPLRADIARLDQERGEETDTARRDGLERVIGPCREHFDTLELLNRRRSIWAQLAEEVLRTLEQIPAKIVSLQIARIESCDIRCADTSRRAETVSEGFTALERTISPAPPGDAGSIS